MEIRAEVGALGPASLAGKALLDVGQPNIVGPVAAIVVQ